MCVCELPAGGSPKIVGVPREERVTLGLLGADCTVLPGSVKTFDRI